MLNVSEARKLVLDLGQIHKATYWIDFTLSYSLGIVGYVLSLTHTATHPPFWLGLLVSVLGIYRAMSFIHELAHFKQKLGSFRLFWNAVAGVPLAFPAFMYTRSHAIHHNPKTYGTSGDGEYLPFHRLPRWHVAAYLLSSFWTPPLLVLRFSVLYPLSLFIEPLRKLLIERGSSVVITFTYKGHPPGPSEIREWRIMETACSAFWLVVIALCALEVFPWRSLGLAYIVMSGALVLNGLRTLAAHRFAGDGSVMTLEGQLVDSVNIVNGFPGWVLSALAAPAGLRFHALHHLFPFIPYHSLPEAHRRLAARLPHGSLYHHTTERGVLPAVWKLWMKRWDPPQTDSQTATAPTLPLAEPAPDHAAPRAQ